MSASQYEDTILSSSGDDETDIFKFYFVERDSGMTNTMQLALEATKERFSDPESIVIMSNVECLNQPKSSLKEKRKYYIFDDFDTKNAAFKYISDVKTVYLLGPRALFSILVEHIKTTSGSYHIHNLSMRATKVTTTNLDKEKKLRIKQLVTYMGGYYSNDLEEDCTHLISESVRSVKYEAASVNNVKIMHPNWVKKVWDKSQVGNVAADDVEYDCFRLPCFNGLCFTSTGLTATAREQLKIAIEENGGQYNASFNQLVDMLLMEDKSIGQLKHTHAKRLKKICINPAWVYDSIKKGYALRIESYEIVGEKPSTAKPDKISTPTKDNVTINKFYPDSTMLSDISRITNFQRNDSIDETMATVASTSAKSSTPAVERKGVIKQISLQAAKIAGSILDGFSFYMSGFSVDELQFLGKVLGLLGATKVDTLGHQISHVLVGEVSAELFRELAKLDNELPIVKVEWIKTMIELKKIVNEDVFLVEQPIRKGVALEKPSPASKKAMKSLSGTFKKPAIPKLDLDVQNDVEENVHMVNQYLNPSASESSFDNSGIVKFLTGKNIFVYGCSSAEESMEIIGKVEELGATLVDATFTHTVDFIITPNVSASTLDHGIKKYKHLVNMLWLVESAEAGVIVDVLFYHKPLIEYKFGSDELPLANEKVAVTNYKGNSRSHINVLVTALGGEYTETLRKSDNAILISPDAEGKKCQSAKDWDSTILKAEWLVECYEKRSRANEIPFLVGGTKASSKNIENNDSVVLSSQDVHSTSHRFDSFDPQVENFDDDDRLATPKANRLIERLKAAETRTADAGSGSYVLDIINGMPTPVREITKAVLLEANAENTDSPRRKRFQEFFGTPTNNKIVALDTPELLRPPKGDFVIRPNASPESQWHHKRKLEGLDNNYVPQPKKTRLKDMIEPIVDTPPFSHRRYDFYKSVLPNYDSPDPRLESNEANKRDETSDATKFLNFDDDTDIPSNIQVMPAYNETLKEFEEFEKLKKSRCEQSSGPKRNLHIDEPASANTERMFPLESEALVEWNYTQQAQVKDTVEPFVFETNGLNVEEKEFVLRELNKLGCETDPDSFTHLITKMPNRGEKYLSAMASGGFIIHIDYVRQCVEANRLVQLDQFEFGNPMFEPTLRKLVEDGNEVMFKAAYKWRKWIKDEEKERFRVGAFTGMTFTLFEAKGKPSGFSKVLKRGGGKLVEVNFDKPPTTSMLKPKNIDFCLSDGKVRLSKSNIEVLAACGIKTLNIKFINDYLSSNEVPRHPSQQL